MQWVFEKMLLLLHLILLRNMKVSFLYIIWMFIGTTGVDIEDYYKKGGVVIIEWANTIKDILPTNRLDIKFKITGENSRILIITPHGKEYEELCETVL